MAKASRRQILALPSTLLLSSLGGRAQETQPNFTSAEDLTLWYDKPATRWVDALPLGNGRLGAMIFGGDKDGVAGSEFIQLNEATFWSGKPMERNPPNVEQHLANVREAVLKGKDYHQADEICQKMQGLFAEAYQPLGTLSISLHQSATVFGYRRELDLSCACASVEYTVDKVQYRREMFASAPDQGLVIRLTASKPHQLTGTVSFGGPLLKASTTIGQNGLLLTAKAAAHVPGAGHPESDSVTLFSDELGSGMYGVAALRVQSEEGVVRSEGNQLKIEGATSLTVAVTVATGFRGFNKLPDTTPTHLAARVESQLDQLANSAYASLRKRHVEDYGRHFHRVAIALGKPDTSRPTNERLRRFAVEEGPSLLALYFQYGRYLLLASSRPGGQPATLQGIWNDQVMAPWSSNWTTNINTEMNYWPAETCNLSECADPLFRFIEELSQTGSETARQMYNLPGWVSHHNVDIWRTSNPVGMGVGSPTWANWGMSAAWLCQHLYEHYRFTGDLAFLRTRAYPIMKGAADFYLGWLIEDGKGHLTTCPSESTENDFLAPDGKPAMTSAGCTMDMALTRELFVNCAAVAGRLDVDAAWAKKLIAASVRLVPYQIGKHGQLQEWSIDFDESTPGQRHMSHLYGLFPGNQITPKGTPELAAAARISLQRRLAAGGAYTGWSRAWAIGFWARLGDGEKAWESLAMLMKHSTNQNLLDTHPAKGGPVFQIDGNFGAIAAMAEMLLQSHTEVIDLLPALPKAWAEGKVNGLRTRGNLEVDLAWSAARLITCRVRAFASDSFRFRTATPQVFASLETNGRPVPFTKRPDRSVQCRFESGREYEISFAPLV